MQYTIFAGIIAIIFAGTFATGLFAAPLAIGSATPPLSVTSGDNRTLTLNMIKDYTVLMFYETKDTKEKNRPLKNALIEFLNAQPANIKAGIFSLPIVNCSAAAWPFIGIWKNSLTDNSQKEGVLIYGDWNGSMLATYKFKDNDSNFMVIDPQGTIRYYNYGVIGPQEIGNIKNILVRIIS